MARAAPQKISVSESLQMLVTQFRGLDTRDPSSWPDLPRYALFVLVAALVLVLLWFLWLKNVDEELETERAKELTLRAQYKDKLQKAVSLDELKKQPWAHAYKLNVTVTNGVVELWGSVESEQERDAIKVVAESIPGVNAVNDHLVRAVVLGY